MHLTDLQMLAVALVSPQRLSVVAPPLVAVTLVMFLVAGFGFWSDRSSDAVSTPSESSEGLGTAVVFGLLRRRFVRGRLGA